MNAIHISQARRIWESGEEISLGFWKKNGETIRAVRCRVTSHHRKNNTINLLFIDSRQVRKIHVIAIFELNNIEVYL